MKTITKLKIQRYINRRSNGVVEQLEKLLTKLQTWIERLDAEQDAANEAMQAEIRAINDAASTRVAELQAEIERTKAGIAGQEAVVAEQYGAIIEESRAEAERAKQVQHNMKALAGLPA